MIPRIQLWLMGVPEVTAIFGSGSALRFYRDEAPPNTEMPYGSFSLVSGRPDNYVDERPGIDSGRWQIDVYAKSQPEVDAAYEVIRDVLEMRGHVVSFNGSAREGATRYFRLSFDIDFWVNRVAPSS